MAIIIVAALCFIAPSFIWALIILTLRLRSKTAVGSIIGYEAGSTDGDVSAPIIEFQLPDGRKFTFTGTYSNETIIDTLYEAFRKYILKRDITQVNILYDPNNPQKARVNSFSNLYLMPVILFLIGFCLILYAIPVFHNILDPIFNFMDRLAGNL
jgi:Protein of unknown function (DUF3592)